MLTGPRRSDLQCVETRGGLHVRGAPAWEEAGTRPRQLPQIPDHCPQAEKRSFLGSVFRESVCIRTNTVPILGNTPARQRQGVQTILGGSTYHIFSKMVKTPIYSGPNKSRDTLVSAITAGPSLPTPQGALAHFAGQHVLGPQAILCPLL
jgi:hypothetical protein